MTAYYNENDPFAAQWLRNLIAAGHIAPGDVDERSIVDVQPDDVRGYAQAHFFAGVGGWSCAARLAGLHDDEPIWTGSCPCQPFSVAGRGAAQSDKRHLWPEFFRLIAAVRPPVVFGEQVAVAAGARDAGEDLPRLQRAQAFLGVLRGQEGPDAARLLRLFEGGGEISEEWFDEAAIGISQEMARREPSGGFAFGGSLSGFAEQLAVRLGRLEGPDPDTFRQGLVRDDRLTAEPERRPNMGQSVTRPNRACTGLHDYERKDRAVRAQCDDEHLGDGSGLEGNGRTEEPRKTKVGGVSGAVRNGVETPTGRDWLDGVCADLEGVGYAIGAAVVPACAVDAPHRRDRLWFVADADDTQRRSEKPRGHVDHRQAARWLEGDGDVAERRDGALGDAMRTPEERQRPVGFSLEPKQETRRSGHASPWSDATLVVGADRKSRRIEPSIRLLAHGVPGRVGRLRAYGNAIVPQVAAEVIGAFYDLRSAAA